MKTATKKIRLSTTQIILFSFLATVLAGSFLLSLPISSANGESVPYIDALFTATTTTCVTGLVTLPTAATWSIFGQAVILVLIQIGGLGVVTVVSGIMLLFNKKMGLGERLLLQDAFNLTTLSGLIKFVKNVLFGTFIIEGTGAIMYMFVFVPEFGLHGIWISVFNAVSAFCNAGIDIIGDNSLCDYSVNPLVNIVTELLIILGGIGYIVWWDFVSVIRHRGSKNKKIFRHLTLHSKIAITCTLGLIFGGALLILIFEYNNPLTVGNLPLFDKIQISLFQSVTTRTAGFVSIPQENLTNASSIVSLILMFIGGSPVGTAGGIKTVTATVLFYTAIACIRDKKNTTIFHRSFTEASVKKAIAVTVTFGMIYLTSTILLSATTNKDFLDIMYETASATTTAGLTRGLTQELNSVGKIIIIITMYFGRVGPITAAVALGSKNENRNIISEPTEEIIVG